MNKIFKSLANNTIIFTIGNGATLLVSFFMVPIYTRILSTSEFGIADIINTTVSMLVPLLSLQIYSAVFRWALDNEGNEKQIFSNGLFITGISSLFSLIIGVGLLFLKVRYAWAIGLNLGGVLFLNHFQNFVRGSNNVKLYTVSGVVASVMNLFSNILLMIIFKFGLMGYLISLIFSNYIAALFLFLFGHLGYYWDRSTISKYEIKKMLTYSIPMIPNSFAWWMTNDASRLIILIFLGPAGNGIYAIANKVPSLVTTVFNLFQNAWQISAVDTLKHKNVSKIYSITFNITLASLIFCSAIAICIIRPFMYYYVSDLFFEAWKFVPILLLTTIFSSVSAFMGTTYLVVKKTKGLFITTVWGTFINLALSFALIPFFGIHGAGISGAVGFTVVSILRLRQTARWISIKIKWELQGILFIGYILLSSIVYINDSLIFLKIIIIAIMGAFILLYIQSIRKLKEIF